MNSGKFTLKPKTVNNQILMLVISQSPLLLADVLIHCVEIKGSLYFSSVKVFKFLSFWHKSFNTMAFKLSVGSPFLNCVK